MLYFDLTVGLVTEEKSKRGHEKGAEAVVQVRVVNATQPQFG
jgi:hypothetical protein